MKGETAELSKLMQNKREEKNTPRDEVFTKKERGERRRLRRKENAKVSAQNFDAAVQVQVAPKPGDNLFKAIAETEVVAAVICKPGVNLFREVKKRGRPPKELLQEQEAQVLQKLYRLTAIDKKFVLVSLDAILDSILSQREGEKEKKEKVPTKKAIEKAAAKAADKKAAEDATTKAAAGAADGATDADEKPADESTETVVGPEPEVKQAAGSAVAFEPAPEESLPPIAEPKEAQVIVAAVVQVGAVEEVDVLKLAIDTLRLESEENVKVQVERLWKDFNSCMESFFSYVSRSPTTRFQKAEG